MHMGTTGLTAKLWNKAQSGWALQFHRLAKMVSLASSLGTQSPVALLSHSYDVSAYDTIPRTPHCVYNIVVN